MTSSLNYARWDRLEVSDSEEEEGGEGIQDEEDYLDEFACGCGHHHHHGDERDHRHPGEEDEDDDDEEYEDDEEYDDDEYEDEDGEEGEGGELTEDDAEIVKKVAAMGIRAAMGSLKAGPGNQVKESKVDGKTASVPARTAEPQNTIQPPPREQNRAPPPPSTPPRVTSPPRFQTPPPFNSTSTNNRKDRVILTPSRLRSKPQPGQGGGAGAGTATFAPPSFPPSNAAQYPSQNYQQRMDDATAHSYAHEGGHHDRPQLPLSTKDEIVSYLTAMLSGQAPLPPLPSLPTQDYQHQPQSQQPPPPAQHHQSPNTNPASPPPMHFPPYPFTTSSPYTAYAYPPLTPFGAPSYFSGYYYPRQRLTSGLPWSEAAKVWEARYGTGSAASSGQGQNAGGKGKCKSQHGNINGIGEDGRKANGVKKGEKNRHGLIHLEDDDDGSGLHEVFFSDPMTWKPERHPKTNRAHGWGLFKHGRDDQPEQDALAVLAIPNSLKRCQINHEIYSARGKDAPEMQFVGALIEAKRRFLDTLEVRDLLQSDYVMRIQMPQIVTASGEPLIWRRFRCPASLRLSVFQDRVLRPLMGWCKDMHSRLLTDYSDGSLFSSPMSAAPDITDVELDNLLFVPDFQYSIAHLVQNVGDTFEWLYDFRNRWYHEIQVEEILPNANGYFSHPPVITVLSGHGACPPEYPLPSDEAPINNANVQWGQVCSVVLLNPSCPKRSKEVEWRKSWNAPNWRCKQPKAMSSPSKSQGKGSSGGGGKSGAKVGSKTHKAGVAAASAPPPEFDVNRFSVDEAQGDVDEALRQFGESLGDNWGQIPDPQFGTVENVYGFQDAHSHVLWPGDESIARQLASYPQAHPYPGDVDPNATLAMPLTGAYGMIKQTLLGPNGAPCANCAKWGNRETLKKCGACGSILYCGRDCQRLHWDARHKAECTRVKQKARKLAERVVNLDSGFYARRTETVPAT